MSIPSELVDFADAIETRSRELLDFVDDLLDLSNLESGLLTLQNGLVDVSAVIEKTIDSVRSDLDANMIRLNADLPDNLFAAGDAQRLERVVRKVLQNAVKFTDTGGDVTISAMGNGEFVRIEIADTGVGIDPAHLNRVANPFVQADDRLNRQYEGKGIGLTVAKRLIEAMSGRFEIASQVGFGTAVTLFIPEAVRENVVE
jgi:two-component system cell cycle sensor histidine kinase PleC